MGGKIQHAKSGILRICLMETLNLPFLICFFWFCLIYINYTVIYYMQCIPFVLRSFSSLFSMVKNTPQQPPRRFTTTPDELFLGSSWRTTDFPNVLMGKLQNVDSKSQRPGNFELLFLVICVGCLDCWTCCVVCCWRWWRKTVRWSCHRCFFSGGGFSWKCVALTRFSTIL